MNMSIRKAWIMLRTDGATITQAGTLSPLALQSVLGAGGALDKVAEALENEKLCFGLMVETADYILAVSDCTQSYSIFYDINTGGVSVDVCDFSYSEPDEKGVLEFASAGYVLGDQTLYKNIRQLQAGEIVIVHKNEAEPKIETHRYYRYQPTPDIGGKSEEKWLKEVGETLDAVIERMLSSIGDRPICVPLSGGLDSRLILAKLCEHGVKDIHTFSYGLDGNFEAKTAQKVADMLGVKWQMVPSKPPKAKALFDGGERKSYATQCHGLSRIPSYVEFEALNSLKRGLIIPEDAVIVNGQSGDYISGGHIPPCLYESDEPVEEDMYRYIFEKHFSLWSHLKTPENERLIGEHIRKILLPDDPSLSRKDNLIRQYESFEWQERQCKMVVNGQKAYDFFGYDWRLPLWDRELMDFFEAVPWDLKYKQNLFKSYLRKWNYKGVFDFMSAEPVMWQPHQFWIKWCARVRGLVMGAEAKNDYYRKMSYYGDCYWQYALFGKELYNRHYKEARNIISLAILEYLEEQGLDFPGDS